MTRMVLAMLFAVLPMVADSGAGLEWTPPSSWKPEAQRPMRLATYMVPPGVGDHESDECGVYYFGPGQGGSVDANLDRWIGQFLQADGKPSRTAAKLDRRSIRGLEVTTVEVSGAYTRMGGPMAQSGSAPKSGYLLLGAIVETSRGSIFFKFTGPEKTVAENQRSFEKMLAGLLQNETRTTARVSEPALHTARRS